MLYHHCFFNFALEYAIRKVQENQVGLKLNGTHQNFLFSVAGINVKKTSMGEKKNELHLFLQMG
jgi:hypothetical protein